MRDHEEAIAMKIFSPTPQGTARLPSAYKMSGTDPNRGLCYAELGGRKASAVAEW